MEIVATPSHLPAHNIYIRVIRAIQEFLDTAGYSEIHVPVLSPALIPESYLEVFETEYRYFDDRAKLYLTPSPELFMKRLIAEGIGSCYRIGSSFRNHERASGLHGGEFTMLEYYRVHADYQEMAQELLSLFAHIAQTVYEKTSISFQGKQVSFDSWERITVIEALEQYADISSDNFLDHTQFIRIARQKGYEVAGASFEEVFSQLYVQEVEPHLGNSGKPTLIYEYPKELASTARLTPDGKFAERFDVYIHGIELGSCFSELTDSQAMETRFTFEQEERKNKGLIEHPIDKGFIDALQYGLDDCSGVALGVDRLAMIFADVSAISDLRLIQIKQTDLVK